MKKILIIFQREYISRVKKKSFIVMTILGPILLAALLIVPVFLAQITTEKNVIAVVDETKLFVDNLQETDNISFVYFDTSIGAAKDDFNPNKYNALLYIPLSAINTPQTMRLFSDKYPSLNVKIYIENQLKNEFESLKLKASGIDENVLKSIETKVNLTTVKFTEDGETEQRSYPEIATVLGIFSGILIYMFIFMFGAQVMRGVIEEKTSRIVEVIVSSVKPFQLMLGKIVGVAFVGLTQFLLWIVLTLFLVTIVQVSFPEKFEIQRPGIVYTADSKMLESEKLKEASDAMGAPQIDQRSEILMAISSINFGVIIGAFIFFFLAGYLLYAALFAAIGSAVDNEADTQQFMLPVTIPLIFAIIMAQVVMNNPGGSLAFWLSIIPFTSPVIMMVRIPFGVPYYEVALSMALLVLGFLFTTWLAAKIYRTGILMYGKKVNYKELWKWLSYRS